LKKALPSKQRSYASRFKVPRRALGATSWFSKSAEPRQRLI
jgi:hypothetical protein